MADRVLSNGRSGKCGHDVHGRTDCHRCRIGRRDQAPSEAHKVVSCRWRCRERNLCASGPASITVGADAGCLCHRTRTTDRHIDWEAGLGKGCGNVGVCIQRDGLRIRRARKRAGESRERPFSSRRRRDDDLLTTGIRSARRTQRDRTGARYTGSQCANRSRHKGDCLGRIASQRKAARTAAGAGIAAAGPTGKVVPGRRRGLQIHRAAAGITARGRRGCSIAHHIHCQRALVLRKVGLDCRGGGNAKRIRIRGAQSVAVAVVEAGKRIVGARRCGSRYIGAAGIA